LFNSLVFLITSFDFSIIWNSGGFVKVGLNLNVLLLSVVVLCLDIPRHFCLIRSESAVRGFGSGSLAINEICGSSLEAEKLICSSSYLGEGVFNSKLVMSFIFFLNDITLSWRRGVEIF
jgi:hypothetical protein